MDTMDSESSDGKTTLYIVVFLCVISVLLGYFYYAMGSSEAEAPKKLADTQAKDSGKEEMLKKAQARVDTKMTDATKRVRVAKELQNKATNATASAEARKKEAGEAMKKAEETKDANAKKLAEEKKRLADLADQKVVRANAEAAKAVNDAKTEAQKAIDLQKRLADAKAKLLGERYVETAKYDAVPGYYTKRFEYAGERLNVADPELCKNEARNRGWAAWGHRNSKHPTQNAKNSCFFYKTVSTTYQGNPKDNIHMVGCAFGGNPKDGCQPGK